MELFNKIIAPIRKLLGVRTFEEERKILMEANKAKRKRNYRDALNLYRRAGNYYLAGKMAEKLGDNGYAIELYETDRSDWDIARVFPFSGSDIRTDRENIPKYPPRFKEAARVYEKLGNWKSAFELLRWYQHHYEAGGVAERAKAYSLAIDEYKKALERWKAYRPDLRQEKITNVKQKIDRIERKMGELQSKKNKGLTSKLNLIAISTCLLFLGLSFLSSNLTGNAIGNMTNQTSTIIGGVLFICALILTFFLLKR